MKETQEQRAERKAEAVRKVVIGAGMEGITTLEVAQQLDMNYHAVSKYASRLLSAGKIECTVPNGGKSNRLGPVGIRAHWVPIFDELRRERKRYKCSQVEPKPVSDIRAHVRKVPNSVFALGAL